MQIESDNESMIWAEFDIRKYKKNIWLENRENGKDICLNRILILTLRKFAVALNTVHFVSFESLLFYLSCRHREYLNIQYEHNPTMKLGILESNLLYPRCVSPSLFSSRRKISGGLYSLFWTILPQKRTRCVEKQRKKIEAQEKRRI